MKRFVVCALSALLSLAVAAPAALADGRAGASGKGGSGGTIVYTSQVFVDLDGFSWAIDAITQFVQSGIIQGVGDGRFAPNELVTREQFAKMLTLTYGSSTDFTRTPTFADVGPNRWSYPYIEACTNYLTAYPNPTGGKLFFRPNEAATREDIAVALVKMMGLSENDVQDSSYLEKTFTDAAMVSPGLRSFITVAAEYGLLQGYADGTFRPQQGITRAEAVVLLSRSTKIAVGADNGKIPADTEPEYDNDLELVATVIHGSRGGDVTIYVEAQAGTRVTVDGHEIIMSQTKPGYTGGSYLHYFKEEGSKTFTVTGKKGNKTRTISVVASYQIDGPFLTVSECPETADDAYVTVKGYVYDKKDPRPSVLVNDKPASIEDDGRWSARVKLEGEGKQTIRIVAGNHMGKETVLTREITCKPAEPTLTITSCKTKVDRPRVEIKGTVNDPFDSTTVTVNGLPTKRDGEKWGRIVDLHEGANTIVVTATNSAGKNVTEERSVTYLPVEEEEEDNRDDEPSRPERINLQWTEIEYDPQNCRFIVNGTADKIDGSYPTVTVNGIKADFVSGNAWKAICPVEEWLPGEYAFDIVATAKDGQTQKKYKTVRIRPEDVPSPEPDGETDESEHAPEDETEPPLVELITPEQKPEDESEPPLIEFITPDDK